jgi:hypothetical protein
MVSNTSGIFLQLLVSQAESALDLSISTPLLDFFPNLGEFRGMLDFLGPGESEIWIRPFHPFFDFHKDTEIGEVSHLGSMLGTTGYFSEILIPGSSLSCLMPRDILRSSRSRVRMLASSQLAHFEEFLSAAQML